MGATDTPSTAHHRDRPSSASAGSCRVMGSLNIGGPAGTKDQATLTAIGRHAPRHRGPSPRPNRRSDSTTCHGPGKDRKRQPVGRHRPRVGGATTEWLDAAPPVPAPLLSPLRRLWRRRGERRETVAGFVRLACQSPARRRRVGGEARTVAATRSNSPCRTPPRTPTPGSLRAPPAATRATHNPLPVARVAPARPRHVRRFPQPSETRPLEGTNYVILLPAPRRYRAARCRISLTRSRRTVPHKSSAVNDLWRLRG